MLRGALVGAAVTLALIAVPVVHFVTAIPSPFIGGYFAGVRTGASAGQAFVLGAISPLPAGGHQRRRARHRDGIQRRRTRPFGEFTSFVARRSFGKIRGGDRGQRLSAAANAWSG